MRSGLRAGQMSTPRNQSVRKAFAVLGAFDEPVEWLSAAELSRRCDLPLATGHRMLQTLEEVGAVVRGPNGRYQPRLALVTLSEAAETV
jgi:IclR family acetate operon transcriptional repressor